jgi:hypothetical protein
MRRVFDQFSIANGPAMQGTCMSETARQKTKTILIDGKICSSLKLVGFENCYDQIHAVHEDVCSNCDIVIIPENRSANEIDLALLWVGVYNILFHFISASKRFLFMLVCFQHSNLMESV